MARICIITPGNIGSTPRVVKEATALSAAGHQVTVIATRMGEFLERRDEDVLRQATWRTIRIDCRPQLQWKAARLRQVAARHAFDALHLHRIAATANSPVAGRLTRAALDTTADLYIAHYPPSLPAAARAAARHGAVYAFDAEDFHLGEMEDYPARTLTHRILKSLESAYLPACAYISAAAPGIADGYSAEYGVARPTVILNVFPAANAPAAPLLKGSAAPGPSVYWFSQYVGAHRGLEVVIRALALSKTNPHFHMRGTRDEEYIKTLEALARECGVSDRLHFHAPELPSQLERLGANFDIGLSPETGHNRNRQVAIGNKVLSYVVSGIPVIASDLESHRHLAERFGSAMKLFKLDDPQSLATAIDTFLCDPDLLAAARRKSWELGQSQFSWELEQTKLLACVEGALSAGASARNDTAGARAKQKSRRGPSASSPNRPGV